MQATVLNDVAYVYHQSYRTNFKVLRCCAARGVGKAQLNLATADGKTPEVHDICIIA